MIGVSIDGKGGRCGFDDVGFGCCVRAELDGEERGGSTGILRRSRRR